VADLPVGTLIMSYPRSTPRTVEAYRLLVSRYRIVDLWWSVASQTKAKLSLP